MITPVQKVLLAGEEWSWGTVMRVFSIPTLCGWLLSHFWNAPPSLVPFPSTSIALTDLFDNQAASVDGTTGDFNGKGATYAAEYLPRGPWVFKGITVMFMLLATLSVCQYDLPTSWGSGYDNVIARGQVVELPEPTFVHELHILYAGDGRYDQFSGKFDLNYNDGSVKELHYTGKNWWRWPMLNWGDIRTPYHFQHYGASKNHNSTQIFQLSFSISSRVALKSIRLPDTTHHPNRLHIFALSMTESIVPSSESSGPELSVRRVHFSTRWESVDGQRAQAVAITLANLLPGSFAKSTSASINSKYEIEVIGEGLTTVRPGVIRRLVPADQVLFDVFILNYNGAGNATVQVKDSQGKVVGASSGWPIVPLREIWTPDESVLSTHEPPAWWSQAKYGIFIHWGPYSVPAWGPPYSYAEWYDWSLHNHNSPTWIHHLQTYGPDVVYDDFIANFTASKWNPSAWLDLFDEAGAKYFVFVTKHHDGYGLFNTKNTTHRNSVHLNPHRDFVKELLDAAKAEKPHLHRGTYFSLPEWFNPHYAKYGFDIWPGGLAHHPYDRSKLESFTGMLNITDYLEDLQYPQMLSLAVDYGTEIMWCDIGGPNKTPEFAAQFYNHAMENGYQVTMNDRCGAVPDFDTPEYARFASLSTRPWETSEGMDPNSYGLNTATDASQYKNGTTIIHTLVDVVSKNGNYLLDVGPTAEGEIITPMTDHLLDAGRWLKYAGECVYATDYWYQASQDPTGSFRFLTTPQTFCIVAFNKPRNGKITVDGGGVVLPIQEGDTIKLLSNSTAQQELGWSMDKNGILTIDAPEDQIDQIDYAWAFQVTYA